MAETATYPKRESHFAHRFCRTMTKAAVVMELGTDVCWFLTVIAHQEDVKRYRPVNYWNEQLMALVGAKSVDKLIRMRNAAVAAGWLHYHSGGKYRPGVYWVLVPAEFEETPDTACDEPDASICTQNGSAANRDQTDTKSAANRTGGRRPIERESSNPKPLSQNPTPKEDCSEASTTPSELAYPRFYVVGGSREWTLTFEHITELAEVFPGVDIEAQAKLAWLWCKDAGPKRKTAGGMRAFLRRWMERAQNESRASPARAGPPRKQTAADRNQESFDQIRELFRERGNENESAAGPLRLAVNGNQSGRDSGVDGSAGRPVG